MTIYVFFHLFLMISAGMLIFAAIASSRKKTGSGWLKTHRRRAFSGAFTALTGVLVMFIYKNYMGYAHFKSPHALGGLVSMAAVFGTLIAGRVLASGKKALKKPHRVMGYLAGGMVASAALFGVFRLLGMLQIM